MTAPAVAYSVASLSPVAISNRAMISGITARIATGHSSRSSAARTFIAPLASIARAAASIKALLVMLSSGCFCDRRWSYWQSCRTSVQALRSGGQENASGLETPAAIPDAEVRSSVGTRLDGEALCHANGDAAASQQ